MSASGSGRTLLIEDTLPNMLGGANQPKWSPDRSKILFFLSARYSAGHQRLRISVFSPRLCLRSNPDYANSLAPLPNLPPNDDLISPAYSPDGSQIVFSMKRITAVPADAGHCLWISDVSGLHLKQLTPCSAAPVYTGDDLYPTWSPDGKYIAYIHSVTGDGNLAVVNADGTNRLQVRDPGLPGFGFVNGGPAWSPDETKIAVGGDYGFACELIHPRDRESPQRISCR